MFTMTRFENHKFRYGYVVKIQFQLQVTAHFLDAMVRDYTHFESGNDALTTHRAFLSFCDDIICARRPGRCTRMQMFDE